MKAVGIRELKNRLSEYVRLVKNNGESILVTDRGAIVAEPNGLPRNVRFQAIVEGDGTRHSNVTLTKSRSRRLEYPGATRRLTYYFSQLAPNDKHHEICLQLTTL